jgi:MFS family permease
VTATPRQSAAEAIRPLWRQVYLPNLVIATGQGAMLPILVYAARNVHASPAIATAVVAINGFGTMAFDLPSGRIVARLGEWKAAWIAAALMCLGLLGCIVAGSWWFLALAVFVQAAGWAVWSLVRITHLSRVAPVHARGRALSFFGGVTRAGNVIGPFFFVFVASRNDTSLAFVIYLIAVVVGFVWLVLARDRTDQEAATVRAERIRPLDVLQEHRSELTISGVAAFGISLLRGSRTAIIPLWAAHIGLDSSQAATLFAYSSVVDLALFYPAGIASDRWGRRADALPCIVLLAIGHVLVPFTHVYLTLFLAALVLGVGNGLGSGIVMTLGADLAPDNGRASFLAVWRLISDGGTSIGPLVDSGVVALATISLAGPVVGGLGFITAAVVAIWLREPEHFGDANPGAPPGSDGSAVTTRP